MDAPASSAAPLGDGEGSSWTGAYEAALEKHGATPWSKGGVPLAERKGAKICKIHKDTCTICGYSGHRRPWKEWRSAFVAPGTPMRRVGRRPGSGVQVVLQEENAKVRRGAAYCSLERRDAPCPVGGSYSTGRAST